MIQSHPPASGYFICRKEGETAAHEAKEGFALIAVLWLVAMLSVLLTVGLAPTLASIQAAEYRLGQKRAKWAAWGCLAFLQARHEGRQAPSVGIDSLALGSTVWCNVSSIDPAIRVNPNAVDSLGLARVLRDSIQVASLLDWVDPDDLPRDAGAERAWYMARQRLTPRNGGFADVREMKLVRGFEAADVGSLQELFTVRGDGEVSPNRADHRVLSSISVLPPGAAEQIISVRERDEPFRTAEDVVLRLGLDPTISEFRRLAGSLSFDDHRHVFRIHGVVDLGRRAARTALVVNMAEVQGRLALTRAEFR